VEVEHLGRGRFDPRILGDLVRAGRRRQARVLHVHGYAAADFGRLAARRLGAALVLHEHFADPHLPSYQALADRLLAPLTDRAIAVSASTRDFLVRERHLPAERVRLIWNGAPLEEFAPRGPQRRLAVRRELGLSPETPVVGSIGRLNEQKGHRYLLAAAARVFAAVPDARLVLAGDGDQEPALRAQARDLGIAPRVVFTGHRTDVPALLESFDVFCISSTYEGTPLTLFEAMAAGRAIVSTAVDGCREVIEDGRTGLLVPPRDDEALARALTRALTDAPLRAALSEAARRESARYDIRECVERMQALYDEVLGERRAAGRGAA
jgi:glycosyltransferase involved in cell wall biosynthesis